MELYSKLPVWMQNAGISVYGYSWKKRRFGGVFATTLKKFKKREFFSVDEWRHYQLSELRKLLKNAYSNVPFYQEKYTQAGFSSAEDFDTFQFKDLPKLPFLEKSELREFCQTTLLNSKLQQSPPMIPIPPAFNNQNIQFFASSGSTGTPVKILYTKSFHQRWSAAFEARIRHWANIDRNTPRGMIGGRRVVPEGIAKPPYYRYNAFEKQTYFSAYHINENSVEDYLNGMRKHKVQYMTGYAMSNFILARFIKESGLRAPKLKCVITSSEKLTPEMRQLFKEVYGCKTYDSYSGVEACGLISENEHGQLLASPDTGIFEIINEEGTPCAPGEYGELISTGLLNHDQPLIRYRIGDIVQLAKNQKNKCGRSMPVIEEIIGRTEDVIIGPDGREMVRFHGIFIDLPNVLRGQIVQKELDDFEINVEVSPASKLTENEKEIMADRMKSQLGEITIKINEHEDQISTSLTPNGKFKAVISHVDRNMLKQGNPQVL